MFQVAPLRHCQVLCLRMLVNSVLFSTCLLRPPMFSSLSSHYTPLSTSYTRRYTWNHHGGYYVFSSPSLDIPVIEEGRSIALARSNRCSQLGWHR
ncbi:hypothetical protein EXIGLDRAFT_346544 [Exidia glandulosa HHB12029]|uniref:Secreted protein n=1 Tax=Exidia glandulosa HHB12029 TaxID=1314781 RepID=A0A165CFV2_EXIGL|nr:hypothetical protein EXIGLDRAFT_346544 [Exidia glandulosa HHB12029]